MIFRVPSHRKEKLASAVLALAAALALAACDSAPSTQASSAPSGPPVPTCPTVAGGSSLVAPTTGKVPADPGATYVASLDPTEATATNPDPFFQYQWHLLNTGQTAFADVPGAAGEDIHQPATLTQTGYGVKVAVVDTGLELAHEDLAQNVVPGASANFNTGGNDPSPATGGTNCTDHGTSVAGLIAARANNGLGGRGVAGMASLVGYNLLGGTQSNADFFSSLGGDFTTSFSRDVDVFNQSYGSSFSSGDLAADPSFSSVETQYQTGAGAGAIYVKAAGNGYFFDEQGVLNCGSQADCQDASFDALNALPYNIVVGALTGGGRPGPSGVAFKTDYSTAGSAVWISAPGGEFGESTALLNANGYMPANPYYDLLPAMVTTDLMGCSRGYSVNYFNIYWAATLNSFDVGGAPNTGCNYTASFNGTSSATPVMSGVVALMRQANSTLNWRDVKYILAKTADQVDPSACCIGSFSGGAFSVPTGAWVTNGAGFMFSRWYGFGRVNANNAVAMASTWKTSNFVAGGFGTTVAKPLVDTSWFPATVTPVNLAFAAYPGAAAVSSQTPTPSVASIEAVRVRVYFTHPNASDVAILLTNVASGTRSTLLVPGNGIATAANNDSLDFVTNAFYGESSANGFTVSMENWPAVPGPVSVGGTLNSWQIRVYGH